ncbi:hypothetical protein [Indioceanicola profundi]|uniref:hypothetical protein n=1 Tax=Indioceanicola profundi TaxID=2220096 RepID=UPI000E6AA409|nr:hypothetical protein [Indioceanicola profundi]
MRRSLALIPAMALALAAQTAIAQESRPADSERIEQPGAVEAPGNAARQELEVQDTDTDEMDGVGDVDIVPQGGAPAAQLNERGPADVPAQDFAEEMQRQPASPQEPEDPLAHLNRTEAQPGQISQPADTGMTAEMQSGSGAETGGQPQPMPAPQGQQDPVPLPDVPEAVAEELRENNVQGVQIPPEVGQPPNPQGNPPQNKPAQGNPPPAGGNPPSTGQPQPQG